MQTRNELHHMLAPAELQSLAAGLEAALPPLEGEHRRALRRRLVARYRGEPPVTAGSTGIVAFKTALGFVGLALSEQGITRLVLPRPNRAAALAPLKRAFPAARTLTPASLPDYGGKLRRYARGEAVTFDELFDLRTLTPFQQLVLTAIRVIPYGQVWTYKQVAAAIGRPGAARAVGNALGKNPVPLMIPCHRVIASSGKLGGYSGPGGVATKQRLLTLERAWAG
ncbi:MAG: methylated-DNA--[protein]-cysteine S-methyltransferase [Anaerolineae bacterium]